MVYLYHQRGNEKSPETKEEEKMYQVKTVRTINDKQIEQMVSALRRFLGEYTRDTLKMEFDFHNSDAAIGFYNFILHEASFNPEPHRSGRT